MTTKAQAHDKAEAIVSKWVVRAALTGWIPGAGFFLAAADMAMIRQVADEFGIGLFDESAIKAHLGGVAAGAIGSGIASEALNFLPIIGHATKAAIMAFKAKAIGEATIDYFYEKSPLAA